MHDRGKTLILRRAVKLPIFLPAIFLILVVQADAQIRRVSPSLDNEAFVTSGLEKFSDTVIARTISELPKNKVALKVEAERFEDRLTNILAERLRRNSPRDVFLHTSDSNSLTTLETKLDAILLSYVGIGRGIFRFPAVERRLQFDGFGRVLDKEDKLLATFTVANLVFSDTLSYAAAEAAAGQGTYLSPPLPPSPYRRVVEPALVLGITGVLVYVFFASR